MQMSRATRALTSWIAILAILMAALAPAIAHALTANGSHPWIEVCTSSGSKWIQSDSSSGDPSSDRSGVQDLAHCPYCTLQVHTPVLLPSQNDVTLPAQAGSSAPVAAIGTPRAPHAWASAQPRAPPSFS